MKAEYAKKGFIKLTQDNGMSLTVPIPKPTAINARICFCIEWYATEEDANIAHIISNQIQGNTYNGGYFHGMACGRESQWDKKDEAGNIIGFAVTR